MNTDGANRRPVNGRETNSNGYRDSNQTRNGAPVESQGQRWYVHVGKSQPVQERRAPPEEKPEESRYYQV